MALCLRNELKLRAMTGAVARWMSATSNFKVRRGDN